GSSFTDYHTNYRNFEFGHFKQVAGNGFSLTALFSLESRKRTRCIDKSNYGFVKFFSHFHKAQGFAVTFRIGHSEVAILTHFGVYSFLLADEHIRLPVNFSKSTYHCLVIAYRSIAV